MRRRELPAKEYGKTQLNEKFIAWQVGLAVDLTPLSVLFSEGKLGYLGTRVYGLQKGSYLYTSLQQYLSLPTPPFPLPNINNPQTPLPSHFSIKHDDEQQAVHQ